MSIKNRLRDLIRPNAISHLDEYGSVKEFEKYRIELMKEVDYKIIKHKSDIAERVTTKNLYNRAEKNIGNVVDDISNISPDIFKHTFKSLYYTFGTIISLFSYNYVNTELFIKSLSEQPKYIADFLRSNVFLQNKGFVSQFESYIPQKLKDQRQYEDEARKVVDNLHLDHKSMIEYDNSGYFKLATISLFDVIEDVSTPALSIIGSIIEVDIKNLLTSVFSSLPYTFKMSLDLLEAAVYLSIGATSSLTNVSSYMLYGAASAIYLSQYAVSNIYPFINDIEIKNIQDTIVSNEYINQFCNYKDNIIWNIKYISNDVTENVKYCYDNIYNYISSIDIIGENIDSDH